MQLQKIFILVLMMIFTGCFTVYGQYETGDDELNRNLIDIDAQARVDFNLFKTDLRQNYQVSAQKIDYLSLKIGMRAGDIYMTLELARISGRSIDQVVDVYRSHKTKGWGYVAKQLGIKPGSAEFHALKGKGKSGYRGHGKGKKKG